MPCRVAHVSMLIPASRRAARKRFLRNPFGVGNVLLECVTPGISYAPAVLSIPNRHVKSPTVQLTAAQEFGRRLRQLRREKSALEERDIEQEEVAAAVGDSQPNVARWEKGRIPKDAAVIRKLAAYYGVSFPWLLTGEGERTPSGLPAGVGALRPRPRPSGAVEDTKKRRA